MLSSDDLFLKSPDMNIGAKGSVDMAHQRVKVVLRLEMLRFLEDIFRYVPITHWLFKKPNKILFPLIVTCWTGRGITCRCGRLFGLDRTPGTSRD